jgi:Flp pilus assembly protein TadB
VVIGGTMIVGVLHARLVCRLFDAQALRHRRRSLIGSYKAPDIFLNNMIQKRTNAIRKGLPDALDLLVICAEAGLTVDAAFSRVSRELGGHTRAGRRIRADLDRAGLPHRPAVRVREPRRAIDLKRFAAWSRP